MTGAGGLAYDRYRTSGSEEWLMRIGPSKGPAILFVPPLLEEMNRTRAFIATMMRALASRGFGCWLLDLPGTGESERPLADCGWSEWRQAVADAARHVGKRSGRTPMVASIRGGAVLDDAVDAPRWRFAPAEGSSLTRDLVRASMSKPDELERPSFNLTGYHLSIMLFSDLKEATTAPGGTLRTVRLVSDRGEADFNVEGPALWRRSEPGNAPEMAQVLADDVADWSRQCGAC